MHRHASLRFPLLFVLSFVGVGMEYAYDVPSALESRFIGSSPICNETSWREQPQPVCLHFDRRTYNWLYTTGTLADGAVALFGSLLADRIGAHRTVVLMPTMFVFGACAFVLAIYLPTFTWTMVTMLVARIFSVGPKGALAASQNKIVCTWFGEHGQSTLALALVDISRRLGTILNFTVTANMAAWLGFPLTLWFGPLLGVGGIVAALASAFIHTRYGPDKEAPKSASDHQAPEAPPKFSWHNLSRFSPTYWCLLLSGVLAICTLAPFMSNGTQFGQDRFGMSQANASYMMAIVQTVTLTMPLFALVVDRTGHNATWVFGSSLLWFLTMVLTFLASALNRPPRHDWMPLWLTAVLMGAGWAAFNPAWLAALPKYGPKGFEAFAFGVTFAAVDVSTSIAMFIVGLLAKATTDLWTNWALFFGFILVMSVASCCAAGAAMYYERRHDDWLARQKEEESR